MPPFALPFTIPSISPHTHTLILLHDRGSTAQEFGLDILNATDSSGNLFQTLFQNTKFIFPTANHQCVTALEGGPRMSQWFDNVSTQDPSVRDVLQYKGLREGCHHLHAIIDDEPVPLENIFVGGFAQGAAMALYALLAYRSEIRNGHLGGFVGMSTWLPLQCSLNGLAPYFSDGNLMDRGFLDDNAQISTRMRDQIGLPPVTAPVPKYNRIPIMLSHGEADDEVPVKLAQQAKETLTSHGMDVSLKTYKDLPSYEWRSGDQITDIAAFLAAQGMTQSSQMI